MQPALREDECRDRAGALRRVVRPLAARLQARQTEHGSWLNLVETLFGKMARTFLRGIRVKSWQELRDRILLGIAEINAAPVIHRWSKFDALDAAS